MALPDLSTQLALGHLGDVEVVPLGHRPQRLNRSVLLLLLIPCSRVGAGGFAVVSG